MQACVSAVQQLILAQETERGLVAARCTAAVMALSSGVKSYPITSLAEELHTPQSLASMRGLQTSGLSLDDLSSSSLLLLLSSLSLSLF